MQGNLKILKKKMSEADGVAEASNLEEGGRIVNLEIQNLEECQYLRTLVDRKMKTVKDLVDKLTGMIPELKESENIKIYKGNAPKDFPRNMVVNRTFFGRIFWAPNIPPQKIEE